MSTRELLQLLFRHLSFFVCCMLLLLFGTLAPVAFAHENHSHGPAPRVVRLDNGLWFDGRVFVAHRLWSVDGILQADHTGAPDTTLDLAGGFVVPPFANAHDHVLADGMNAGQQMENLLRQGIFYVKNPNNTVKLTAAIRAEVNHPWSVDVAYANGGLTASGGHPIQIYRSLVDQGHIPGWSHADLENQAYFVIDRAEDLDTKWPIVMAGQPDFIKVYLEHSDQFAARRDDPASFGQRGLDPALLPAIVARAHDSGLRVTAHVATSTDFHNAVDSGVDEVGHLPLATIAEADARQAGQRGIVVVTTTLSHRPGGHAPGLDTIHRDNLRLLQRCGVAIAVGTDNGDVSVLDEIENLVRLQALEVPALLRTCFETTSNTIFPQRRLGKLLPGYEASFLVLDGDPTQDLVHLRGVRMRFKQGRLLRRNGMVPGAEKPPIGDVVQHLVTVRGLEAAVARYRVLHSQHGSEYDFSEPELNRVGYRLLNTHRPDDAITMLRLNTEVYPSSANAFDSLAEAYEARGDSAGVRRCAEKVLELLQNGSSYSPAFRVQLEESARKRLATSSAASR